MARLSLIYGRASKSEPGKGPAEEPAQKAGKSQTAKPGKKAARLRRKEIRAMRMRDELEQKVGLRFSKGLLAATNQEIYQALLELTQKSWRRPGPSPGSGSCTTSPRSFWWASCSPTT